jgi:hypothetical protein
MVAYVKQIPLLVSPFLRYVRSAEEKRKRRGGGRGHTMNRTMIHRVFGLNGSNRLLSLLSPYSSAILIADEETWGYVRYLGPPVLWINLCKLLQS